MTNDTITDETISDTPQEPATAAEAPTDAEESTEPTLEAQHADDPRGNKEAAKYRRLLRDTETERDSLREQLHQARTLRVQDALKASLAWNDVTAAAITAAGHDIPSLVTDTGDVDLDALGAVVAATRDALGIQRPRLIVPMEGDTPQITDTASFADAFKPKAPGHA